MVIDVIFKIWWNPIISNPNQYGLLKEHKADNNVKENIKNLMALLYYTLTQIPFDKNFYMIDKVLVEKT
jgi:hypothetical protein